LVAVKSPWRFNGAATTSLFIILHNKSSRLSFSLLHSVSKKVFFGTLFNFREWYKMPFSLLRSCTTVPREGKKTASTKDAATQFDTVSLNYIYQSMIYSHIFFMFMFFVCSCAFIDSLSSRLFFVCCDFIL